MKITAIRIGKLVSGPGFNNRRFEAEAQIDDNETPEEVRERLEAFVDDHLRVRGDVDRAHTTLREFQEAIHTAEVTLKKLNAEIDAKKAPTADGPEISF